MPRSSKWSLPFRSSDYSFLCISHLLHAYFLSCPSCIFDLITFMLFNDKYRLWCSSLCISLHIAFTSSLEVWVLSSEFCSQTPSVCIRLQTFTVNKRDKIFLGNKPHQSRPEVSVSETVSEMMVLYSGLTWLITQDLIIFKLCSFLMMRNTFHTNMKQHIKL
jgi:hypothetical protein